MLSGSDVPHCQSGLCALLSGVLCLRVHEALTSDSVHEGWHSHATGTEVGVGLPLCKPLFHGGSLLPLAHHPAAPRLVLAPGTHLICDVVALKHSRCSLPLQKDRISDID